MYYSNGKKITNNYEDYKQKSIIEELPGDKEVFDFCVVYFRNRLNYNYGENKFYFQWVEFIYIK